MIEQIRKDLKKHIDQKYGENIEKHTKEGIILYGVRIHMVRKISGQYFKKIEDMSKQEIFAQCELLLQSGYIEEMIIAFDWVFCLRKKYAESDFRVFENWLKQYVVNWGTCDDFCTHAFGEFMYQYPQFVSTVKEWTRSDNRWVKRAAAVVMIYSIRRNKYIDHAFEIADFLLLDQDYMVQKDGWMLKEISNLHPQKVFEYVQNHKNEMPRTALRYAIEKLDPALKEKAMTRVK
ncbi:MAG: DNA alkylation repair protein [Candidatus Methanofastidiosia archaeon]